ncbi:hypothetical protein RM739_09630 [Staphylococcus epidermidis]|uniref:hypothetical protein n=1 Tax=Staphylococcus epidermidis TaxID=1282 RepID=UPI001D0D1222|nr:hypothetical protein [Staphylococcus epidermidis]MCC2071319.1 hypothetical protein [Staphylococcus epidermidis]MDT0653895.1 hypothetical protein [Staphylococcus epidermidis]UXR89232.1 hypothetical protein MUA29_01285 [Staphylococcus epidermidis]
MVRKKNLKNKKDTIKVVEKKESILSKLLRTKVDNALDEDMSFDDIIDICNSITTPENRGREPHLDDPNWLG